MEDDRAATVGAGRNEVEARSSQDDSPGTTSTGRSTAAAVPPELRLAAAAIGQRAVVLRFSTTHVSTMGTIAKITRMTQSSAGLREKLFS